MGGIFSAKIELKFFNKKVDEWETRKSLGKRRQMD